MTHPRAIVSLYDEPMWKSIEAGRWELQQCNDCGTHRYPPAPICHGLGGMFSSAATLVCGTEIPS